MTDHLHLKSFHKGNDAKHAALAYFIIVGHVACRTGFLWLSILFLQRFHLFKLGFVIHLPVQYVGRYKPFANQFYKVVAQACNTFITGHLPFIFGASIITAHFRAKRAFANVAIGTFYFGQAVFYKG